MSRPRHKLRSYWNGQAVQTAMRDLMRETLNVLAYQTQQAAQARIVRRGYGSTFDTKFTKSGKYRGRWQETKKYKQIYRRIKTGKALTKSQRKSLVKMQNGHLLGRTKVRVYQRSKPGQSPTNQRGVLKASIRYGSSESSGLLHSLAGAIALSQTGKGKFNHASMTDGMATRALEWGGYSRNARGRLVRIAPRPFIRPAALEVLRSGALTRALSGRLSMHFSGANPSSGLASRMGALMR